VDLKPFYTNIGTGQRALIPLEWLEDVKRFEGFSADRKQPVEFYRVGGEQYLIYERYKMKRIGTI
jgi:hypothetical protein